MYQEIIEDGHVITGTHNFTGQMQFSPDSQHLVFTATNEMTGTAVIEDGRRVMGRERAFESSVGIRASTRLLRD